MIPASFSIALGANLFLFIVLVLAAIGAGIFFYRYTLPPLPTFPRIVLSTLRSLTLSLLLLMLFEPVVRFKNSKEQAPTLAVLVDRSQSMTIKDTGGDRAAAVRQFLKNNNLYQSSKGIRIKYFEFSSKAQPLPDELPDTLSFPGETTDLSAILNEMKEYVQGENIQSIVLVTDGVHTTGKNPLYSAEALTIPIYTLGVGDTAQQKDIVIEKVVTNNLTYAETRVPVDIMIGTSGYSNENVEVTVFEGSNVLERKSIKVNERVRTYPIRLFVEPAEEGVKKYSVSVSKLEGELTEKNNVSSFFIKVLRSKLNILLIAGAPSPDVAAVRQILAEDPHLSTHTLIQKSLNEFYEGALSRSQLDSADCLIFVGFPSIVTGGDVLSQLQDAVEKQHIPMLFINGKGVDFKKSQFFSGLLPFTWSNTNSGEILVLPSLEERQKHHPLVVLEGKFSIDGWSQLPPIFKLQTIFRIKPEAEVIAYTKLHNVQLAEPLIAIRNISRQKTFAITGHGIWRWRLLAQGNPQTEQFLPLLMSNAVRWLTTKEDDKNVRVVPLKETFTTAEEVGLTGQVYDEQSKPVDDAELTVELHRGNENIQFAMNSVGNGRYEGSINGVGEGDYTYTAKATIGGKTYGEDKGRFSVGQMNVEFIETKMNKELLEQIAYRTGGKYYEISNAASVTRDLTADVKFSQRETMEIKEIELWNWKYFAGIIILLLAAEWFHRKRNGML